MSRNNSEINSSTVSALVAFLHSNALTETVM